MPPQRTITSSKEGKVRQRSSKACEPCRKRKIKCDGNEPCEACVGYGYECKFTTSRTHKRPSSVVAGSPATDVGSLKTQEVAFSMAPVSKTDSQTSPHMATECLVVGPTTKPFLLQSLKTRFTSAYSAIAWPRALGVSLDMSTPPRLQSFAWNPGHRVEPKVVPQRNICDIITLEEMCEFSDVYFKVVNPVFGILDRDLYKQRASEFWTSQKRGTDFEATICGVVALGSYFSYAPPLLTENEVVEQGRLLLDLTVAHPPAWLSVKHVQAWILRTLYLRSTTRPHLAWLASNTTVHIAESIGLHREITGSHIKRNVPRIISTHEIEIRRKVFWMCMGINQFLSFESGRTRANIELICCQQPSLQRDDLFSQNLAILRSVPRTQNLLGRGQELFEILDAALALPANSPFLGSLKADACFGIFRMLRSSNVNLSSSQIAAILEVIRVGLDGAIFSTSMSKPWWNVVGTPFHGLCVLLSLGTSEALAMVPLALKTIQNAAAKFESHLSREALRTAFDLVQAARSKRGKELESLNSGLDVIGDSIPPPDLQSSSSEANLQWSMENELGFPDFLDFGDYRIDDETFLTLNLNNFSATGQNGGL